MRIGVLGMGRMGQAIAGRLLDSGHAVAVWNRSPGRTDELVGRGAARASSIEEAVRPNDVVITSLATDDAVREVALGQGGVSSYLRGSLYADASTVSPTLSGQLAEHCQQFVAMPIVGSPEAVGSGRAVTLAGGPDGAIERLEPVLASLSSASHRYPTAPLAASAKLATNLLLLNGIVALAESFAAGRAGGLSDDQLRQLLGDSPMLAPGITNRFEAVLSGSGPTWWTVALGTKDAGLALELAGQAGEELPVTAAVRGRYLEAAGQGHQDGDIAEVAALYRREADHRRAGPTGGGVL